MPPGVGLGGSKSMVDFRSNEADRIAGVQGRRVPSACSLRSTSVSPVDVAFRAASWSFDMDYAKPSDVVASMIDASPKKLVLAPRDIMIRAANAGVLPGAATTLALTGAVQAAE